MIPCKSRSDARYLTHRLPSQIDFLAQDLAVGNESLILSSHAVHTVSTLLAQRCQDRSDCDDCIRNARRQMWLSLSLLPRTEFEVLLRQWTVQPLGKTHVAASVRGYRRGGSWRNQLTFQIQRLACCFAVVAFRLGDGLAWRRFSLLLQDDNCHLPLGSVFTVAMLIQSVDLVESPAFWNPTQRGRFLTGLDDDDTGLIRSGASAVADRRVCNPIGWEDQFHSTSPVWRQAPEKGRVGGTSQTEIILSIDLVGFMRE